MGRIRVIATFPKIPDGNLMNVTDLVATDGSSRASVLAEVDDLDAFKAFIASLPPEIAAQAESHGVVMATLTVYLEA